MYQTETTLGPNQAVEDRVIVLVRDPEATSRNPDGWARLRSRAFNDNNLLEAAAVTMAQYKVAAGTVVPIENRVLELLREPGSIGRSHEQWREIRSKAWTAGNIIEAAAMTFVQYLLNFRAPHAPRNAAYL